MLQITVSDPPACEVVKSALGVRGPSRSFVWYLGQTVDAWSEEHLDRIACSVSSFWYSHVRRTDGGPRDGASSDNGSSAKNNNIYVRSECS